MNESSLRQLLARLGVQVVERASSGWLSAPCPFAPYLHARGTDRRPSFGAKVEEGGISSYFCQGCKMHGRISSLARALGYHRHGNLAHYADVSWDADQADRDGYRYRWYDEDRSQEEEPQEPLVEAAYANMYYPVTGVPQGMEYLRSRGVGPEAAAYLDLRWDSNQDRILFPVRGPSGELYGFSGRATHPEAQTKIRDYPPLKKKQHVLGAHLWHWGNSDVPLIIVEGLIGFAWLVQIGVCHYADVGALMGSELSDWKKNIISRRNARTYLLVDNDQGGQICLFGRLDREGQHDMDSGAVRRLERLVPLYVPMWPEGKDDPDQLTLQDIFDILYYTPLQNISPSV